MPQTRATAPQFQESLILSTISAPETQSRGGGRLRTVSCFSAKNEKYTYLRRVSHPCWRVENRFRNKDSYPCIYKHKYIYIYIYIFIFIYFHFISQLKAFGPVNLGLAFCKAEQPIAS